MAGASAYGLTDLSTSVAAMKDLVIIWLDKCAIDYEKCKEELTSDRNRRQPQWKFFSESDKDKCYQFIKQAGFTQILVFVSSGRLIQSFVDEIHTLPQLHSIYIYCNKKDKYESWKNTYKKVHGVFDDPIQLCNSMRENLEEARRVQRDLSAVTKITSLPKLARLPIPCLFDQAMKSFYQPNYVWSPWKTNIWTLKLPFRGQGTIEIRQRQLIPFQLYAFGEEGLTGCIPNICGIKLIVDTNEIHLSTVEARDGQQLCLRNQRTEQPQRSQMNYSYWRRYWLTFSGEHQMLRFGIGEVRPKFKIFDENFNEFEKSVIKNAFYIHLKIGGDASSTTMEKLNDEMKIFVGEEPILFEPPLLIVSQTEFSSTHPVPNTSVLAPLLKNSCLDLYHQVIQFTLNDSKFPNLIKTIERSITYEQGWCHRKLKEKHKRSARYRLETFSIRISVKETDDGLLKYPCVLEIWPNGHYSQVRAFQNAYGIIRVLHGKILIKFLPEPSANIHQDLLFEQLFEQDQVTWMMPYLNQTHQMTHPDMYGSCCILMQCFHYEAEENQHGNRWNLVPNDGHHNEPSDNAFDTDFLTFKKAMAEESLAPALPP